MKHLVRFSLLFGFALSLILPIFSDRSNAQLRPSEDEAHEAAEQWRRMTWQDERGQIFPDAFYRATQQRLEALARRKALSKATAESELLPSAWVSRGPQNVGGRTRGLIIHPTNPNLLWAASDTGGIWKTSDGGQNWAPLGDSLPSLVPNGFVLDPANPDVLYTGLGTFDTGQGIFKSTDGGTTWNRLASTANWNTSSQKRNVTSLAIAPTNSNLLLVSTYYGGLRRSTDGGNVWTLVRGSQFSQQVLFHPTDSTKALAQISDYDFSQSKWFYQAVYSTDGGATWTDAKFDGNTRIDGEVRLAIARSDPNIVYAFQRTGNGKLWRSSDGGQNYTLVKPEAYGTWGGVVWVCPTDPNFVILGAVQLYKSTDGGSTFTQMSNGYILDRLPHVDHHYILADPGFNGTTNKRVFFCSDGGVFRTDDVFTASTTSGWVDLNKTYQTSQFYGAVGHGKTGRYIGGTQDNGTLRVFDNAPTANYTFGGDGGYNALDPTDDNYAYGEYIYLQVHRSRNGGLFSNYIYNGIGDAGSGSTANFIAPFILDPNNPNRMLGGGKSLWASNNVKTATAPTWSAIKPADTQQISAIAAAYGNANVIWVAHNDGKVYKTTNGLAATPAWTMIDDNAAANPFPNRMVRRLLIDPTNTNKVYVTLGGFTDNNLWRTTDGGVTWTDISGTGNTGLPFAPVHGLARHPDNPNWLYAGTEVGLFTSQDGGSTWSTTSEGPGNVAVDEVSFMHYSSVLLAATYGRGLWTTDIKCDGCGGTPPAITAAASISRLAGSSGAVASLATVNDAESISNNLLVTATSIPTGLTFTNITNINGAISATVTANCNAAGGENKVTLTVTDGTGAATTAMLTVNVTANTSPTLGAYNSLAVNAGTALTVKTSDTPKDNLAVTSVTATAPGFTGTITVNATTGIVTISNAAPVGEHTVTVRATDGCGAATTSTFKLTVYNAAASVNGANYLGPDLAADSIVSAFGLNLATETIGAPTLPLPTTLGGTTVKVKDSAGVERPAALFFVSETQVNYQIPTGTAMGAATATITNKDGIATPCAINVGAVAPGFFSADATGKGLAAADAVYVKGAQQTYIPVFRFDATLGKIVATPIDLSGDPVVLVLYGTGLRHRTSLGNVKVKVDGVEVPVDYAGNQNGYAGLDQLNAPLLKTLSGRGEVAVEVMVDGKAVNPVRIAIR